MHFFRPKAHKYIALTFFVRDQLPRITQVQLLAAAQPSSTTLSEVQGSFSPCASPTPRGTVTRLVNWCEVPLRSARQQVPLRIRYCCSHGCVPSSLNDFTSIEMSEDDFHEVHLPLSSERLIAIFCHGGLSSDDKALALYCT